MKKSILSVFIMVLCMTFLLAGCATVTDVKTPEGKNYYAEEMEYYGGQIAKVGDYVYFANGYTSSSSSDFNYDKAKKSGYISRVKSTAGLTFDDKVENDRKVYTTPKEVEKVCGNKLVGYEAQDMFVLGSYIYFSSPNTHKTTDMENDYTRISLFRMKFNGDGGAKELVSNSAFKKDDKSIIRAEKGSDGNYYYIIIEPAEESLYTIKSLKIGDSLGKLNTLVEDVKTFAICNSESSSKTILYTVDSENEIATTEVKSVDFASGEETLLDSGVVGSTTELITRVGDEVFYSYSNKGITEVYCKDISNGQSNFNPTSNQRFYPAKTISDVKKVGNGYIFKGCKGAILYKEISDTNASVLVESDQFTDILYVDGDYVYLSTSTQIKRVDTIDKSIEVLVTLSENDLISGEFGYDGEYLYFFSKVLPASDNEEENEKTDDNYYMFRADKQGNTQLLGQTVKM